MTGLMDMLGGTAGAGLPGTLLELKDLRAAASRRVREAAIRSRCQSVPLDPHTVLCRVLGRYKFLVDSRDLGLSPHLMLDGYWESWCTEFMLRRIRRGQVAWDIGANLGYYAVLMADLVGPEGRVLALEPNPRLATLCARSLSLNGFWHNAEVQRLAAAEVSGETLRFRATISDPKNGRLVDAALPDAAARDEDVLDFAVQAMRLDDLGQGAVDFIKIDVEGAEEQVWAGMQGLLDRSPAITVVMEFNALRCRAPGAMLDEAATRFPLRELALNGKVVPVTPADILPRREDTLLVLTNEKL
ncbi:FkbM family methyltransferase [Falsiroseomonas sp.]|uniref:FkbM family methyltransferase n=1 Tax=Falsiroseomonas sp. TaxID=2870721 RepID=UPI0034A5CAEB